MESRRASTGCPSPAECLRQHKDEIIRIWESRARSELPAAASKPHYVLIASLPQCLDELALSLEASRLKRVAVQDIAEGPAAERAHVTGYTLKQVQYEYSILRQVIFSVLERYMELSPETRDAILDFIVESRVAAAEAFVRLAQERESIANAELRSSEERFRTVFNLVPQMLWSTDESGKSSFYNEQWYRFTGLTPGRGSEEGWQKVIHSEDLARLNEAWASGSNEGAPVALEVRIRRYDGNYHWFLVRALPIRGEDGKVAQWYGSATDIHDLKQALNGLEQERALREGFVNMLSHDLRTPLTAAKMAAEMIARAPENAERVINMVPRVIDSIRRVDLMIQDLLDASRIRAGIGISTEFEDCDLSELVRTVCDELQTFHGQRLVCQVDGPLKGRWSAKNLQRVIENLVGNAFKYGARDRPVTIRAGENGAEAELSVHNFGKPIPPEELGRLFEPYAWTKEAEAGHSQGWGLGLTLVRGVVEAHRGRILVESTLEKGTTFRLLLPRESGLDSR